MNREAIYRSEAASRRKFGLILALVIAFAAASIFLAALAGKAQIPPRAVAETLLGALGLKDGSTVDSTWKLIVLDIRFSRICLAMLVGMALAVAGTVFQGVLRNPLADPFTIGVSTGAAFGGSVALFFGAGSAQWLGFGLVPLASLAGAMIALVAVVALGRVGGQLRRDTMVLAGIVVATFLSALISLLKSLDEESVASIVFWVMGSFQGRGWSHLLLALPYATAGLILIWTCSRELDILSIGDTQAKLLGVNAERARLLLMIGASLVTAAAVSVSGVIGFVGLIMPHLMRMTVGAEHRRLLLLSALTGGLALVWSDVLARSILPGGEELPVGVVTALMGGPFFCFLLKRQRQGSEL